MFWYLWHYFSAERVTNPQNQKADIAATEAFCVMLSKETDGPAIATKLLATQIQSSNECESLQALTVRIFPEFLPKFRDEIFISGHDLHKLDIN